MKFTTTAVISFP